MVKRFKSNNAELQHLMQQHEVSLVEVGELLSLKVYQDKRRPNTKLCPRAARWCVKAGRKSHLEMPDNLLELLKLKLPAYLKQRAKQQHKAK
jgi:hypothetical protein